MSGIIWLTETSFFVTWDNFGEIFHHSRMVENELPLDAKQRQEYAEKIATKYNCNVSYRAIYSTKKDICDLMKAREELINSMYVSPIFWAPIGEYGENDFYHLNTFAFGFFPYCEKRPFVFNDNVKINIYDSKFDDIYTKVSVQNLHQLISQRIKLINCKLKPDTILFEHRNFYTDEPLSFTLTKSDFRFIEMMDDSKYSESLTSQEYFNAVIQDNKIEEFIIPEYKMIFAKTTEKNTWPKENIDYTIQRKIFDVWRLLSKRIAVTNINTLIYDGYYCLWFHYDDECLDLIYQHFGFFDTWYYNPTDLINEIV